MQRASSLTRSVVMDLLKLKLASIDQQFFYAIVI